MVSHAYQHRAEFANMLGAEQNAVLSALDVHQATDKHDWAAEVARDLERTQDEILRVLARIWMRDPSHVDECRSLVKVLAELGN